MNELPNGANADKAGRWVAAILRGMVVFVLTFALLTVPAVIFFYATDSGAILFMPLIISIMLGIREILKHPPQRLT